MQFGRRGFLLLCGQILGISLLLSKMSFLQVFQRDRYLTASLKNISSVRYLPSVRGRILDMRNVAIAQDVWRFRLVTDNEHEWVDAFLSRHPEMRKRLENGLVILGDDLDWQSCVDIITQEAVLQLRVERYLKRSYPFSYAIAHITGYVTRVYQEDPPKLHELAKKYRYMRTGRAGIEKTYNEELSGKLVKEQKYLYTKSSVTNRQPYIDGKDIALTIDAGLQNFIYQQGYTKLAAVVMDMRGLVRACISLPSFDPNALSSVYHDKNSQKPFNQGDTGYDGTTAPTFLNMAVNSLFQPASVFKLVLSIAGLSVPGFDPNQKVYCSGKTVTDGGAVYRCWYQQGHGFVDMKKAIACSCNIYYYRLVDMLGMDTIVKYARMFGLDTYYDLGIGQEKAGFIPSPGWKKKTEAQPWYQGDTWNIAIGQGYIGATTLSLAVMLARLVTSSTVMPAIQASEQVRPQPIDIPPEHIQYVLDGMRGTIYEKYGTAYNINADPKLQMYGKTGTAQTHKLFVSYMPHAGGYVACAIVPGAKRWPHPLVRDIFLYLYDRLV